MYDRSSTNRINQVTRTRRIATGLILLALALPALFVWRDHAALSDAGDFTIRLVAVTLLAVIALQWVAHHYSPGIQVQVLLAFALVLVGWSGYVSRIAHEERMLATTQTGQTGSSMPALIPGQAAIVDPKSVPAGQR